MSLRQPPRRPIASHCRDSWCTQRTDVRLASSAAPCSLPFFPNQSYPIAYSFSFQKRDKYFISSTSFLFTQPNQLRNQFGIPEHQVIPFKSPLKKGDSRGCVFSGLLYNPLAPYGRPG